MRDTQRKGDIAKTIALAEFTKLGYDVATLLTESAAYDIIVDCMGILRRVQVKYTSNKLVDLRRIHSNSTGYIIKKYSENDFDWLFIYWEGHGAYLITQSLANKGSITLNDKYKLEAARLVEEIALKATGA